MANKRIETARKELDKWTAKVSEMTQAVSEKETTLASIESSLGELVISGGDVSKAQAEMDRIRRDLQALHAGLQVAQAKVTQARKDLETLERAELENRVRQAQVQGEALFQEIMETLEKLAEQAQALGDLSRETNSIKQTQDVTVPYSFSQNTWWNLSKQARSMARGFRRAHQMQ